MYIAWYKKINPIWWLGNLDEPSPPDWYRPEWGYIRRFVFWYFRNPFHNFTFYVIGVADKVKNGEASRSGKYPNDVFSPVGGVNYAATSFSNNITAAIVSLIVYAFIALVLLYMRNKPLTAVFLFCNIFVVLRVALCWLPFFSYIGKFKFYIGWREKGNLGFKLTRNN